MELVSKSEKETKKFSKKLALSVLRPICGVKRTAFMVSLEGDLGTGKTTFTQGFAEGLGVKEKVQSPTFVILKIYDVPRSKKKFIHVDAYRLQVKDFKVLGWKEFIKNPENIILVEWGNRIRKILPKNTIRFVFKHKKNPKERTISIF